MQYIKESAKKSRKALGQFTIFNKISFIFSGPLPEVVDPIEVIALIERRIPKKLDYDVEEILVGEFSFLSKRNVNAVYEGGTIYVTNQQDSAHTLVDDIVHEIAHSLEANYGSDIYADNRLASEYLGKKERILERLREQGMTVQQAWYKKVEYNESFDKFLYQEIGYPVLSSLSADLFMSPYAITSLREYFANGFEHYYSEEREYVKTMCPVLYTKLSKL